MASCPEDNYSPWLEAQVPVTGLAEDLLGQEVKTKMSAFCTADTSEDILARYSVSQLIDMNYCPPWWVQSQEVLGRCLPSLTRSVLSGIAKYLIIKQDEVFLAPSVDSK